MRHHRIPAALWLLLAWAAVANSAPPARIFTQTGVALAADGQPLPPVAVNPADRDGLRHLSFPLGRHRELILITDLDPARDPDLDHLARIIRRCHDHVETATGRQVDGDMLLYIIAFDRLPRAYSFRVELATPGRWSQVRLAMVEPDQPLCGLGAPSQLRRLIYGTLPHELGHQLIDQQPTVRHDVGSQASHHTRWFIEGVCEWLALGFAQQECPPHAWQLLRDRRVDGVLASADLRARLMRWAQADRLSWELESDLYGAAMLLTGAWLQATPLPELLGELAASGGDHDGTALRERMLRDLHADLTGAFLLAAREGRRLAAPNVSLR